jgi:hypothetical protein
MEEENSVSARCKFVSLQKGGRIKEVCGRRDGAVKEDVSMTPLIKQTIQMYRLVFPVIFVCKRAIQSIKQQRKMTVSVG